MKAVLIFTTLSFISVCGWSQGPAPITDVQKFVESSYDFQTKLNEARARGATLTCSNYTLIGSQIFEPQAQGLLRTQISTYRANCNILEVKADPGTWYYNLVAIVTSDEGELGHPENKTWGEPYVQSLQFLWVAQPD